MEEQAFLKCKFPGCGNKHYLDTDLYYDGSNKCLDDLELRQSCAIAGAITNPGCLMYVRAYDNSPANRPNSGHGEIPDDFWEDID